MLSLLLAESLCQYDYTTYDYYGGSGSGDGTTSSASWTTWEDTTYPIDTTEDPTDAEMETKIVTDVEIGNEMHTMTLKFRIRKK